MSEYLLQAEWTRRADLAALIAALGPGQARYVGGAVRDTLLDLPVSDIDLATPLPPKATMARLAEAGIRSVPTGIAHGTITALLAQGPVEITTLREDVATDGRHAVVAFGEDWQADAARRDFTINALYADPADGRVFDYFDGLADLAIRRVRFIGNAATRIREDHLRILRYFRFDARFGSQVIDEASEAACGSLAPMLKGLSRERIGMELMKLLALPDPAPTVARMARLGVFAVILPEARCDALPALIQAEVVAAIGPDPLRRLAALLPPEPPVAEQVAARLRLSTRERKRLVSAAGYREGIGDPRALAHNIGHEQALDRLLLSGGDVSAITAWSPPTFPLKGGAIVARGVKAGPDVARILQAVERRWVAEGFPDEHRVAHLLDEVLAS